MNAMSGNREYRGSVTFKEHKDKSAQKYVDVWAHENMALSHLSSSIPCVGSVQISANNFCDCQDSIKCKEA